MTKRDDEYNPFRNMRRMHEMIDSLFDDMITPGMHSKIVRGDGFRQPVTDIWENETSVVVTMELPGVTKDDIQLDIHETTMTVKVEKRENMSVEKEGKFSQSISQKKFYTEVELPSEVVADKAEATYNNGVLEITIPKKEESKRKKIKVK